MNPRGLPADERRAQILDAAHRLFTTKGYSATTIVDIMDAVGIAKGTLYHHFASKEHILVGLVERTNTQIGERAAAAAAEPGTPLERFFRVLAQARVDDTAFIEHLHAAGNAELHVLSIVGTVHALTPPLTDIVKDGIRTGDFSTTQPRESVEIILAAAGTLLDGGIFDEPEHLERRTRGLAVAAAQLLGCDTDAVTTYLRGQQ